MFSKLPPLRTLTARWRGCGSAGMHGSSRPSSGTAVLVCGCRLGADAPLELAGPPTPPRAATPRFACEASSCPPASSRSLLRHLRRRRDCLATDGGRWNAVLLFRTVPVALSGWAAAGAYRL